MEHRQTEKVLERSDRIDLKEKRKFLLGLGCANITNKKKTLQGARLGGE